jgi:hypothetical protein
LILAELPAQNRIVADHSTFLRHWRRPLSWAEVGEGGDSLSPLEDKVEQMKLFRILVLLLLVIIIYVTAGTAALSAKEVVHIQMHTTQINQTSRRGEAFQGSQLVRPSQRERDAISEVLMTKPRPKTLTDADMKLLKELLNKPTWFGFEQRIVHDIWAEVSGKKWPDTDGAVSPRNKTSP